MEHMADRGTRPAADRETPEIRQKTDEGAQVYDRYINETAARGFLQKGPNAYGEYQGFPLYCTFGGKGSAAGPVASYGSWMEF